MEYEKAVDSNEPRLQTVRPLPELYPGQGLIKQKEQKVFMIARPAERGLRFGVQSACPGNFIEPQTDVMEIAVGTAGQ